MNRRQFLAAMGLSAGSLTLPSRARAQDAPPLRFLLFYTSQGCVPSRWTCDPQALGDVDRDEDWTTWDEADFSDSLRPLFGWAHRATAIGGLGLVSAAADGSGYQHERATAHSLSGARARWVDGVPYTGDQTIDQRIATHLARPDRYRSLEVSVHDGLQYHAPGRTAVYQGPVQPITPIDDPRALWRRLFDPTQLGPVALRQASVLDAVADRYDTLAPRLSGEDRRKLELHRDLVRDLEVRLGGITDATCPGAPTTPEDYGDYEADFESHLGLLAAALSCDLTRVASIQMGQLSPTQLGLPNGDMHEAYAHAIYGDPAAEDAMAAYMAHHAGHFARVLEVLDSIPEGDGSLLDHTVVAWMSELADSWHGMDGYPVVVAGGGGLRTGRYVSYARTSAYAALNPTGDPWMGVPHQRLLLSLCHAVGLELDTLGVTEVEGWDSPIDCTGPLPQLLR